MNAIQRKPRALREEGCRGFLRDFPSKNPRTRTRHQKINRSSDDSREEAPLAAANNNWCAFGVSLPRVFTTVVSGLLWQ